MPRIRTLKPEFWCDEKLAPLDPVTRLTFLGLISQADCAGRLVDNVKMIDAFVFPMTQHKTGDALKTLAELGRICRYKTCSGQACIQIVNWKRHQRIDNPGKIILPPAPPEVLAAIPLVIPSREPREDDARVSREASEGIMEVGSRNKDQRHLSASADIERVFDFWLRLFNLNGRVKLTQGRRGKIRARLKDSTMEEIEACLRGWASDPWRHEDLERHDLQALLRNREAIEKGIAKGEKTAKEQAPYEPKDDLNLWGNPDDDEA